MAILSCKETECQRKVLARGMCSTHYSYWHREQNTHTITCAYCLESKPVGRKGQEYCSNICKQRGMLMIARAASAAARKTKSSEIVKRIKPRVWLGSEVRGSAWVMGSCVNCGDNFVARAGGRYCSGKCRQRNKEHRRFLRYGEFSVIDTVRLNIYKRDKNTCQLCKEAVDTSLHHTHPMSATLDHIIPQSWMLIPDHSEGNLRLAHRRCNSSRGASATWEAVGA